MAFKTFAAGDVLTASDVNTYLMKQAVIVCTSGTRPSSPNEGMTIYETDTDKILTYTGSTWSTVAYAGDGESYTPSIQGSSSNPTMGNSTVIGRYWRMGTSRVDVFISIKIGNTYSAGSGSYAITLPVAVNSTYDRQSIPMTFYDASVPTYYRGFMHAGEDAALGVTNLNEGKLFYHNDGATGMAGVTNAAPVAPATGDIYQVTGTYYV